MINLFHIEYSVIKTGMDYICKIVGTDREDVIRELSGVWGEIRVISIYHQCEVHRVSKTIRKQIIEKSVSNEPTTKGKGRPKKYNFW